MRIDISSEIIISFILGAGLSKEGLALLYPCEMPFRNLKATLQGYEVISSSEEATLQWYEVISSSEETALQGYEVISSSEETTLQGYEVVSSNEEAILQGYKAVSTIYKDTFPVWKAPVFWDVRFYLSLPSEKFGLL